MGAVAGLGQNQHNTADGVPLNAQSGQRTIAMMGANHRHCRAWLTQDPLQGSMPFRVELDSIKDIGVPVQSAAVSPVAVD